MKVRRFRHEFGCECGSQRCKKRLEVMPRAWVLRLFELMASAPGARVQVSRRMARVEADKKALMLTLTTGVQAVLSRACQLPPQSFGEELNVCDRVTGER